MAESRFETVTYEADKLVESAGTILFRLSTREVCILHLLKRDEYILPKGRRNLHESRPTTAIRETTEETGIQCSLLPVSIVSRVCPNTDGDVPDEARLFNRSYEAIATQVRSIGKGELKLIWWYVAAVDESKLPGPHESQKFKVEFYNFDTVLEKLTFKDDRELVRKAIKLVESSVGVQ